jgi:hypothetical protein
MCTRQRDRQTVMVEVVQHQLGGGNRWNQHTDVDALLTRPQLLLTRRGFLQMQLNLRILLAEAADQAWQAAIQRTAHIAYAQAAGLPGGASRVRCSACSACCSVAPRLHQQRLPGHGQAQGTVAAHDQFASKFVFQPTYRCRQRWLRHVQAGGGTMEMQLFGHGHELAKQAQVDHLGAGSGNLLGYAVSCARLRWRGRWPATGATDSMLSAVTAQIRGYATCSASCRRSAWNCPLLARRPHLSRQRVDAR